MNIEIQAQKFATCKNNQCALKVKAELPAQKVPLHKKLCNKFPEMPKFRIKRIIINHPKMNFPKLAEMIANRINKLVLNEDQTLIFEQLRPQFPKMPEFAMKKIIVNNSDKTIQEISVRLGKRVARNAANAEKLGKKSRSPSENKKDTAWDLNAQIKYDNLIANLPGVNQNLIGRVVKNHPKKDVPKLTEVIQTRLLARNVSGCNNAEKKTHKMCEEKPKSRSPSKGNKKAAGVWDINSQIKYDNLIANLPGVNQNLIGRVVKNHPNKDVPKLTEIINTRVAENMKKNKECLQNENSQPWKRKMTCEERQKFQNLKQVYSQLPEKRLKNIIKRNTHMDEVALSE